jgi:hypothetical protein
MPFHRVTRFLSKVVMPTLAAFLLAVMPFAARAITSIPHMTIPAAVTISDPIENVKFAGTISVDGKVIDDLVFNSTQVIELVIDFSNVKGVGAKTGNQFITDAQAILHRPLKSSDIVEVTFPYYLESDPSVSRTAVASFEVSFAGANNVTMKLNLKPVAF